MRLWEGWDFLTHIPLPTWVSAGSVAVAYGAQCSWLVSPEEEIGLLGTALGGRAGVGGETIRFHFVLGTAQAAPKRGVLWAAGQWDEECESVFLCAPQTAANSSTTARTTNTAGRSNGSWMRAGTESMVRHRPAALPEAGCGGATQSWFTLQ